MKKIKDARGRMVLGHTGQRDEAGHSRGNRSKPGGEGIRSRPRRQDRGRRHQQNDRGIGDISDIKQELGVKNGKPVSSRKQYGLHLGFSLWGSGLIVALFIFINVYYTPDDIWFVYPTFAVAWWPLVMFYKWLGWK